MNYPQFKGIENYFNTPGNLTSTDSNDDGRINSLLDEEYNLKNASKVFDDLEIYPPRRFADFKLFNPFNWKSTNTNTADNCSA